ncbi:FAD/NAD(P)-binding domain-containing protein [Dichomitus squalens]|uniref:FAD/NAD(P)-binding domain-containing protein n=1 Tax=Dichomitus squalens TaxID=114155 RepID=A0A4Q9M7L1_9APHY|nr:FAD/NAD(P)-binding domain-containing protein [Dichomitus squalens]
MHSQSALSIEFIIVGGAISGLASAVSLARVGHKVTVLDDSSDFYDTPMGAGARIPPNATKVLYRWGMEEALREVAVKSTGVLFAQFDNGSIVGTHEWEESVLEETGGDFLLLSYGDLRRILAEFAVKHGAVLRPNSQVISVQPDAERPSVTLITGEVLTGDVIIGADGCHVPPYHTRRVVLEATEQEDIEKPMGLQLFNALVPWSAVDKLDDPTAANVKETGKLCTWFGRTYGALGFPVKEPGTGASLFTLFVYVERDDDDMTVVYAGKEHLVRWLHGCDPRLRTLAESAEKIICIPMIERPFLEEWIHPDGPLLCIGESAHPIAAGSIYALSMSIGDAAVLGKLFSHLHRKEQIPIFLNAVQEIREPRVQSVLKASLGNIFAVSLPPGIAEQRDRELRERAEQEVRNLGRAGTQTTSEEMIMAIEGIFAYDPEDSADDWWQQWGITHERAQRLFFGGSFELNVATEEED